MSAQIISGKKIANKIKDNIVKQITKLSDRPNLAIILVDGRTDSDLYVKLKEKEGKKIGIDTHLYKFEKETSEEELLECINFINNDKLVDGVLLQLPLPKHLNTNKIVKALDVNKDVDGFHPENLKKIHSSLPLLTKEGVGGRSFITPPMAKVIIEICQNIKCDLEGKKVALLAHSDIFMQGVGNILEAQGAKILPCSYNKDDKDKLQNCTKQADIIITAIGKKHYLTKDYIKPDAIIIDIGIIREEGKTFGDVDFEDVKDVAGFITPVPGGVGPITIACAFENVLELYSQKHK